MPSADVYGRNGVSDFLAIKQPKLFMAIETKYNDVVTAWQFKFLTDVHNAGHHAFLVDETNIDTLRALLDLDLSDYRSEHIPGSLMRWQDQIPTSEKP